MKNFKNLQVWQKGMNHVTTIYTATMKFPDAEKFGLTSQLRRSAVSIPTNIAEGSGRRSEKEYMQFLYISLGSAFEVETLLLCAKNINILNSEIAEDLLAEVKEIQRMLSGLINKIGNDN